MWSCMKAKLIIIYFNDSYSQFEIPLDSWNFKLSTCPRFYYHRLVGSLYFQTGEVFIFQNIPDRSKVYTSNLSKVLFSKYHRHVGSSYFLPVWDNFEIKPWTGWKFIIPPSLRLKIITDCLEVHTSYLCGIISK